MSADAPRTIPSSTPHPPESGRRTGAPAPHTTRAPPRGGRPHSHPDAGQDPVRRPRPFPPAPPPWPLPRAGARARARAGGPGAVRWAGSGAFAAGAMSTGAAEATSTGAAVGAFRGTGAGTLTGTRAPAGTSTGAGAGTLTGALTPPRTPPPAVYPQFPHTCGGAEGGALQVGRAGREGLPRPRPQFRRGGVEKETAGALGGISVRAARRGPRSAAAHIGGGAWRIP